MTKYHVGEMVCGGVQAFENKKVKLLNHLVFRHIVPQEFPVWILTARSQNVIEIRRSVMLSTRKREGLYSYSWPGSRRGQCTDKTADCAC